MLNGMNPEAVRSGAGNKFASSNRSVVALTAARVTPSDDGAVGSEADTVNLAACDGDEVGIGRNVVA